MVANLKQMFEEDIEIKARKLEEVHRKYVINCGEFRVVICDESMSRAHPELERAAQDFVRAINFVGHMRGLGIETINLDSYRRRMKGQGITLNY